VQTKARVFPTTFGMALRLQVAVGLMFFSLTVGYLLISLLALRMMEHDGLLSSRHGYFSTFTTKFNTGHFRITVKSDSEQQKAEAAHPLSSSRHRTQSAKRGANAEAAHRRQRGRRGSTDAPQKSARGGRDSPGKPTAIASADSSEPTQARRAQCKAARRRKRSKRPGLLLSQQSLAHQRVFDVEQPLHLDSYNASLLPKTAGIADKVPGGWERCAVVGSSGSVLSRTDGAQIDAHQQVIRINRVRTSGFEERVGRKTTINVFWGHHVHLDAFAALTQKKSAGAAGAACGLVVPVKPADVSFYFDSVANSTMGESTEDSVLPTSLLFLMSDFIYLTAMGWLCDSTHEGAAWPTNSSIIRPSSGMIAVAFALQACKQVSLFGLGSNEPCAPHHYFDAAPERCSRQVPAQYDHPFHWFEGEHRIYAELVSRKHGAVGGHLTVVS